MRIGFDITTLLLKHNYGVPVVVESLVREFMARPQEISLLLTSGETEEEMSASLARRGIDFGDAKPGLLSRRQDYVLRAKDKLSRVSERRLPAAKPLLHLGAQSLSPILNSRFNRRLREPRPLHLFHHPDYVVPYWTALKCPHVVTIHDMIPVVLKEYCSDHWLAVAEEVYEFARSRAACIVTYSESSRRDIIEHLKVPAEKVRSIPLAVRASLSQEVAPERIHEVTRKYGLAAKSYFLAVGRLDVLKNLERLVEAFAVLSHEPGTQDVKLVLTGPASGASKVDGRAAVAGLIHKHGLADRVVLTGYVEDEELFALMKGCACFVYPTLYEGFGLPVLEAMTLGAPVIASRVSSVPEVAGEAALLVDPYSCEGIADAMRRVISDTTLAQSLVAKGLQRAGIFSWDKTASQYLDMYRSVV